MANKDWKQPAVPDANLTNYLDDPSDDELPALGAARSKQDVEVMLAVFPPFELIEHTFGERSETLGTHETARMEEFSIWIDYFCLRFEPIITTGAGNTVQVHDSWHGPANGVQIPRIFDNMFELLTDVERDCLELVYHILASAASEPTLDRAASKHD